MSGKFKQSILYSAINFCGVWALLILVPLLLSSCKPEVETVSTEIEKAFVGGKAYCMPKTYMHPLQGTDPTSLYARMTYPDFLPFTKSRSDYFKDGEQWKLIRILVEDQADLKPWRESVELTVKNNGSTIIHGNEYGLEKRIKPSDVKGAQQDSDEMWMEKNGKQYVGMLKCSKQLTANSVPQCKFRFLYGPTIVTASFNKKLLPDAVNVKENIITLLNKYNCTQSSLEKEGNDAAAN